jgi:PAS domain S-box-containing protein
MAVARRGLEVTQVSLARLIGMALLCLMVFVHDHFIFDTFALRGFVGVSAVIMSYGVAAYLLLGRFARHPRVSQINDVLFGLDIVVWTFAIYATGGNRSWLFFLMILRAIDQAPFGFRRVIVYAHVSVACYALLIGYLMGVEGRPLAAGAEAGKLAIIWLTNLYVCAVAASVERVRSRRRDAEQALRASEARNREQLHALHAIIDAIPTPIFYKDTDAVYRGANRAFLAYLGKSREEVIGKSVFDLSPRDLAEVYHKADVALFASRGTQSYETNVQYADGSRHDVVFYKAVFFDADGNLAGLVGSILDITERKRREVETSNLFEATAALAAARDHAAVLDAITRQTVRLIGCDVGAVLRYDPERGALAMVHGFNSPAPMQNVLVRPGEGVTGRAFAERRPVWTRDLQAEPMIDEDAESVRIIRGGVPRGLLAVPILMGEVVYGVVVAQFATPHDFTESEVQLLTAFAHQASTAIEKQALLRAAEERRQLAEALAELARAVAQGVAIEQIHQSVVDNVRELLRCDNARLFYLDADAGEVVLRAISGATFDTLPAAVRMPIGAGVAGKSMIERRPVATRDLVDDPNVWLPDALRLQLAGGSMRAYLAAPLIVGGDVIGALTVGTRVGHIFSAEEIQLAQTFADQAGVAIARAAPAGGEGALGGARDRVRRDPRPRAGDDAALRGDGGARRRGGHRPRAGPDHGEGRGAVGLRLRRHAALQRRRGSPPVRPRLQPAH